MGSYTTYSQCINGVSTNPLAPTNNSLPNNQDPKFLNGFRWWLDYNNYSIPLNNMGLNQNET
jgi:hypothetical protein